MNKSLLLDTNYLIDLMLAERPERTAALALFDEIADGTIEAHAAATSFKDVYYIGRKYTAESEARRFISSCLTFIQVAPVDSDVVTHALASDEPDFEDGIVRACAERMGASYIISRDEAAFVRGPIKRLSAQDYVDLFIGQTAR